MSRKLLRNPTTHKICRNPDTGKLRVGDPADDCAGSCEFIQAKLCSDDSDADLWFAYHASSTSIDCAAGAGFLLPYYFLKDSVHYYVLDTNNTSSTPGTLCNGETPEDYCPTCGCPNCSDDTPQTFSVTFADVANCRDCLCSNSILLSGELNGTYMLTRNSDSFPCIWSLRISYPDGPIEVAFCQTNPTRCKTLELVLTKTSATTFTLVAYQFVNPGFCSSYDLVFFYGTLTATSTCSGGPYVINNANDGCGNYALARVSFDNRGCQVATGGTATLTPSDPIDCGGTTCPDDCSGCCDDLVFTLGGTEGGCDDGDYHFTRSGCGWSEANGTLSCTSGVWYLHIANATCNNSPGTSGCAYNFSVAADGSGCPPTTGWALDSITGPCSNTPTLGVTCPP